MSTIDKLRELNDNITKLLKDPEPGLFTWRECLHDAMQELYSFYWEPLPKDLKERKELEERVSQLEQTIDEIRSIGGGR